MLKLTMKRRRNWQRNKDAAETNSAEPSKEMTVSSKQESFINMACFDGKERECLQHLFSFCFHENQEVSDRLVIRCAAHHNFNYKKAKAAIVKGYNYSSLNIKMEDELARFIMQTMVVFPLPGLKTRKTGSEVVYFRPSRFLKASHNNHLLMDNLCYVLNDMSRSINQCRNGVVLIVNLEGFSAKHHHTDTQKKLSRIFEGYVVPTRIVHILLVNPTKIFKRLWKMVSPAMSKAHRKTNHLIKDRDELGKHLMDDYERYLPDEFLGFTSAQEMATDYCDMKRYEEARQTWSE